MATDLAPAIAGLYEVFARYSMKPRIAGCPCCMDDAEESLLHAAPLRALPATTLDPIGGSLLLTVGDVDDFRHLLPRWFELIATGELELDEEISINKLGHAEWASWDPRERAAVDRYLQALVLGVIAETPARLDSVITGIALAVPDVTPYLDLVHAAPGESGVRAIEVLLERCGTNAFLDDQLVRREQIRSWLRSAATRDQVEAVWLALTAADPAADLTWIENVAAQLSWL